MDFAEVYVYIGKEHKINSEYKKCSFTSISSQEWGSLYTWQKYQRPVWSHHRLFTLRNKSTRFSLFFPPFWIAACWSFDDEMLQSVQSLMLWISQLLPLVFFLSFTSFTLSSQALFFKVQHLSSCGCAAICIWMSSGPAVSVWDNILRNQMGRKRREGKWRAICWLSSFEMCAITAPSNLTATHSYCYRLLTIPSGPSYSQCA